MPTNKTGNALVSKHLRMWPREIFDRIDLIGKGRGKQPLTEELKQPGVYILYRDDAPYYVGKAKNMRVRLRTHATDPASHLYHFWNFFSAFVIKNERLMSQLEGVLIAAMPTANGASPRLPKQAMPKTVRNLLRDIRRAKALVSSKT
jgi:GIY-YIG catalytic domain